ncbi:MAG: hypothetical protein V4547_18970 [Bacteroidota bacterium]
MKSHLKAIGIFWGVIGGLTVCFGALGAIIGVENTFCAICLLIVLLAMVAGLYAGIYDSVKNK